MSRAALPLVLCLALTPACRRSTREATPEPAASASTSANRTMSRAEFNRIAVRLNLPLFWKADTNGNSEPDADEIATLLFYPTSDSVDVARSRDAILAFPAQPTPSGLPPDLAQRRELVGRDLDQGQPTLIDTDLRASSPEDHKLFAHMLAAAHAIDDLYATMRGAKALASRVPASEEESRSLFRRDWGPACAGARTAREHACSAIPGAPAPLADAYPEGMQSDPGFCAKLEKSANAKDLMDHFAVVRESGGARTSVPYTQAYAAGMGAVATELRAAAADETDPKEASLKGYLEAAAQSFATNDWGPADEAWSRMNAQNSRWYVRAAPDEVLADPCKLKAQFHLTLAHVDPASLAWQSKLTPVEADMERALAALIGPPYAARAVTFHLPDFIDIVLNAGDDRQPIGATAGESLPNWGKVADEGRGRTVAMVNIGLDTDSLAMRRAQTQSLIDAASMKGWSDDPAGALIGTILHEATHNLGPTDVYAVQGKKPEAVFGGGLASMLEELKAETGAMYYLDWLRAKGLVTLEQQQRAYAAWMNWAMRHIATGVHSGGGDEAYSQLSAIQVGFAMDDGGVTFDPAASDANGTDRGAFTIHYDKLPATFEKMMKAVGTIKAKGDKAGAQALVAKYVDGPTVPMALVSERVLRFPQSTLVYAVER